MAPEEIRLDLDPPTVAALRWNDGAGPRVLALHGWLDNAASFIPLGERLDDLNMVALDLPGHGRSHPFPAGWFGHFVDWVPVVLETADRLQWKRFALIGHSMGAGIATLVAAVAPERIDRIVLLEGLGPMTAPAAEAPERLARALAHERRRRDDRNRRFPDLDAAVAARRRGTELDAASSRLLVERGTEPDGNGVRFTHDPRLRLRSRLRMTDEQVHAFLDAVRCPVLAVRARDGWPFPPDVVARRLEHIADLETLVVDGGHHVHLTHSERLGDPLREFLRRSSSPHD